MASAELKNLSHTAKGPSDAPETFNTDRFFLLIVVFSFLVHFVFVFMVKQVDIKAIPEPTIEELPQRLVKILMDKPKVPEKVKVAEKAAASSETAARTEDPAEVSKGSSGPQGKVSAKRVAAQKNVAKRAQRVERELRTTGVLALLTGRGPTRSSSRAVADIMGGASTKGVDLDAALKGVTGVQRAGSEADMEVKLTTKKVVNSDKVSIEDFVQSFGKKDKAFDKLGSIEITRPKTVGTASASAKRDDKLIADYVKENMRSIKAAYERILKNKPDLSGKITIRFTILASGRVSDVEVTDSTVDDPELADKIIKVVRNWRFPEIPDTEGSVTVNFPFIFQPK